MARKRSYEMLPVQEIHLDMSNPRITQYTEMYGTKDLTPEQLHLALGVGSTDKDSSGTTFAGLEASIRTNGGVIHPIIVNKKPSGCLVAIEGNTRVAIYRRFLERGYKGQWDKIPAVVYEDLSQAEIDAIRLQSHLVGPRPWDAYAKGKYLHYLSESDHLPMAQIVEFCGNKPREVQTYIEAYESMERYYRPKLESDADFDRTRFSAYVELHKTPRIQQAILNSGFTYDDFARWIIDRKIHPLITVRQLPRILADKRSRKIFLKDGARAALEALVVPSDDSSLRGASLEALARALGRKIRTMPFDEVRRLRSETDGPDAQALTEAKDELDTLYAEIFQDE